MSVTCDTSCRCPSRRPWPLRSPVRRRFASRSKDASTPLVLDFETSRDHVKSVEANGRAAAFTYVNGHIVVPPAALVAGANTVRIAFDAGDASLNRSADFLYTLFVPARARLAIPVFDQPDLKAPLDADTRAPRRVAAAAQRRRNSRATTTGDRTTVRFAETQPLPTYLVLVRRGRLQDGDRRAQRPHVPHVPPRDRRRQGGAQQGRHLRPARARPRVPGALHRHPLRLRQVRLRR